MVVQELNVDEADDRCGSDDHGRVDTAHEHEDRFKGVAGTLFEGDYLECASPYPSPETGPPRLLAHTPGAR